MAQSPTGAHPGGAHKSAPLAQASLFRGVVRGMLPLYLLTLVSERPLYGQEIMQSFSDMSGGRWHPSPGSVYPTLKKLEAQGLLEGEWQSGRAAARKVYAITERGGVALPAMQRRLLDELRAVKGVVDQHIVALEAVVEDQGDRGDPHGAQAMREAHAAPLKSSTHAADEAALRDKETIR